MRNKEAHREALLLKKDTKDENWCFFITSKLIYFLTNFTHLGRKLIIFPKRTIFLHAFSTCFVVKAHNSERNSYNESLLDTVLMVSSETPKDAIAFMRTIEIIEGGSARTVDTPCKHDVNGKLAFRRTSKIMK